MEKKIIRVGDKIKVVPISTPKRGVITMRELAQMFYKDQLSITEISLRLKTSYFAANKLINQLLAIGMYEHIRVDKSEVQTYQESYKDLLIEDVEENPKLKDLIGINAQN